MQKRRVRIAIMVATMVMLAVMLPMRELLLPALQGLLLLHLPEAVAVVAVGVAGGVLVVMAGQLGQLSRLQAQAARADHLRPAAAAAAVEYRWQLHRVALTHVDGRSCFR